MRNGGFVALALFLTVAIAAGQQRPADQLPRAGPGGVPVFNPVEGRIRVLSARPQGSRVEKGEIVCELDPAGLRDRLDGQEFAVRGPCRTASPGNPVPATGGLVPAPGPR